MQAAKAMRAVCKFRPTSGACPTEYTDYPETRDSALALLSGIEGFHTSVQSAIQNADKLGDTRQALKNPESTSGSTGVRVAILPARVRLLESSVSEVLATMSSRIDDVISNGKTRTRR